MFSKIFKSNSWLNAKKEKTKFFYYFSSKKENNNDKEKKAEGLIKVFKKDGRYYISFKNLLEKYKIIGVIFSRKMRDEHDNTWNNVVALGTFIVCVFLFWWRLKDFRFTLLNYQPYAVKPLISKKVASEQELTLEDLNFIYERPSEYELDDEVRKTVEGFRKNKGLEINQNYKIEAKRHYAESLKRNNLV